MKFEQLVFYVFFSFLNIFTNDMIKATFFFVGASLKNIKIRNEFMKRISIITQKLAVSFYSCIFLKKIV